MEQLRNRITSKVWKLEGDANWMSEGMITLFKNVAKEIWKFLNGLGVVRRNLSGRMKVFKTR